MKCFKHINLNIHEGGGGYFNPSMNAKGNRAGQVLSDAEFAQIAGPFLSMTLTKYN